MKPYEQGALDGLCAVYGIVNAARVTAGIDDQQSKELFKKIVLYLERKNGLQEMLVSGIGLKTIGGILNYVVRDLIPIRNMPYKHHPETPLDEFWDAMVCFMGTGEKRAIFIGLGGVYDHWSIVDQITDKQIRLFDSFKLKKLNRSKCSTTRRTAARPHLLFPTHTYFLSQE
jgi:hypothetical protein